LLRDNDLYRLLARTWAEAKLLLRRCVLQIGRKSRLQSYLRQSKIRKVHIGCGSNLLPGWLNCDIDQCSSEVIFLDARRKLPFPNESVHYVFAEHFIEHLDRQQGLCFLKECYRVLVAGGILRLSTPDLQKLMLIYFGQNDEVRQSDALDRHRKQNLPYPEIHPVTPCSYFNDKMRLWGHRFIYDKSHLFGSLKEAGFQSVIEVSFGISEDPELQNLEHHADVVWMQRAEILIVEARKQSERS